MKKLIQFLFILAFSNGCLRGQITQPPGVIIVATAPSGACTAGVQGQMVTSTGAIWTCQSGTWATVGGGTGFANPMTTAGDLIVGGSGGAAQRLAVGPTGDVLTVVGGVPAWAAGGGNYGLSLTPPVAANFSWINQGTASLQTTNNLLSVLAPIVASPVEVIRIQEATLPGSTPWTLTAAIICSPLLSSNYLSCGIGVKDAGNNHILFFQLSAGGFNVTEYSNASNGIAVVLGPGVTAPSPSGLLWMRIHNDGTNFTYSFSPDAGMDFTALATTAVSAYLVSPATAFFGVKSNPSFALAGGLASWTLTTP